MNRKHYYILPDGSKAETMKEGHTQLCIGSTAFRNLISKGIVKKIEVEQSNAYSYVKNEKAI